MPSKIFLAHQALYNLSYLLEIKELYQKYNVTKRLPARSFAQILGKKNNLT
jgi:hypothetical protein